MSAALPVLGKVVKTKRNSPLWIVAGILAVIGDALAYLFPPSDIPGISNLKDLLITAALFKLVGPIALVDLVGQIPAEGFIPTFTPTVILAYIMAN